MEKRRLFFHLGLPKTATTYLQRHVFGKLQDIRYLGRHDGLDDHETFINVLANYLHFYPRQSLYHHKNDALNSILEEEKKQFGAVNEKHDLLVSDEGLTFRFFDAFDKQWYGRSAACSENFFERLHWFSSHSSCEIYPILVYRKQSDWLPSFFAEKYMHLVNFDKTRSFPEFLDYALGEGYYSHGFNNLDYTYQQELISSIFKTDKYLMLPYEMLVDNPERFISEIATFTGTRFPGIMDHFIENASRNMSENEERKVRIVIERDPSYRRLRAIKHRIMGGAPVPSKIAGDIVKSVRYPKTTRTFSVTREQMERIDTFFASSNTAFIKSNPIFAEYW